MVDIAKLTPTFMKHILSAEFALIAKHEEMKRTLYEMTAALCYHAPLVRPALTRAYARYAMIIEQPSHLLVYEPFDKERVRAYAAGTLTEPSVPPKPVGFLIPSGNTKKVHTGSATVEPLYHTLAGKLYVGEYPAARACMAIWEHGQH